MLLKYTTISYDAYVLCISVLIASSILFGFRNRSLSDLKIICKYLSYVILIFRSVLSIAAYAFDGAQMLTVVIPT